MKINPSTPVNAIAHEFGETISDILPPDKGYALVVFQSNPPQFAFASNQPANVVCAVLEGWVEQLKIGLASEAAAKEPK